MNCICGTGTPACAILFSLQMLRPNQLSLLDLVALSSFDRPQNLIHLFVGGSELHGAKVGQTDDTDLYGVYIEAPEQALGLNPREHFVWSTAGDDAATARTTLT